MVVGMALGCSQVICPVVAEVSFTSKDCAFPWRIQQHQPQLLSGFFPKLRISAVSSGGDDINKKATAPNSNYVVPLDKASCITRPLAEILRDLNRRIPENIIIKSQDDQSTFIPWYQANRMLSFYAPGWCGEIRDVIFSENSSVTVVYRITVRGSDGEAHRESTGTVSIVDHNTADPVSAAEQIAFCRACARFGLGLYLFHED